MPETARDPLDTAVATVLDEIGALRDERDYYLGLLVTMSLQGLGYKPDTFVTEATQIEADRLRAALRSAGQRHDSDDGWLGRPVGDYRRLGRDRY